MSKLHTSILDPEGRYGIWDTVKKYFIGNEEGPNRYSKWIHAKMAAAVATEMFGRKVEPKPIREPLEDTGVIIPKISAPQALQMVMNRQ